MIDKPSEDYRGYEHTKIQCLQKSIMKTPIGILFSLAFVLVSCVPVARSGTDGNLPVSTPAQTALPAIRSIPELVMLPYILTVEEQTTGVEEVDQKAVLYKFTYLSDGYTVVGYVTAPKDYLEQPEPYPVLILNRGGQADTFALNSNSLPHISINFEAIVFASQYRETHEGTGKDEFGGDDVHDVIKLLDFVDQCTFADKDHIVMWGASRGSIMTFEVLRMDDRVRAAIVTGSVPDLVAVYNFRDQHMKNILKYRVGGTPEEVPGEYERRSAIHWAEEINAPILIFHTEDDWKAPIEPVDEFVALLESLGKEVEYIRNEEGGHGWSDPAVILEFFKVHTRSLP